MWQEIIKKELNIDGISYNPFTQRLILKRQDGEKRFFKKGKVIKRPTHQKYIISVKPIIQSINMVGELEYMRMFNKIYDLHIKAIISFLRERLNKKVNI